MLPCDKRIIVFFLNSEAVGAEGTYRLEQLSPESARMRSHKSSMKDKEETVGAESELISG